MKAPTLELRQALQEAVFRLQAAGIDTPRLDAEVLLAHCLQVERSYLLAHPEASLSSEQYTCFALLLARREAREPLAYLTGERWFFGLKFRVNHHVLVPRPETEMLVERALEWLQQRVDISPIVVDVGTGSGAIAISLARHAPPSTTIIATELSSSALSVARYNARRHHVLPRIHLVQSDLLSAVGGPVHLVLANLPYVSAQERPYLMPEVRDYEPELALFAGDSGLELIECCLREASSRLAPGGAVLLEIGYQQGKAVQTLARRYFNKACVIIYSDLAGLPRLVSIQTPPFIPST
ncbi:MAG: peptide chain release factor N(5)-glutamine methyltransferase [Chloroflexi bacterium]|nr:peptide chain release factor N(5)-glutamine methyltransferase [Chloroflexota bacterium]